MTIRLRLVLGLLAAAGRWHAHPRWAAIAVAYWLRPYCWRLDQRHWRWPHHRRCTAAACLIDLRTLAERDADFERALQRLVERAPAADSKEYRG